jgi:DNA-binding CsgD family transcriptional regulator
VTRLGIADYEAALSFIEDAHSLEGPAPFTPELLQRLAQLAGCESADFFRFDHEQRRIVEHIPCASLLDHDLTPDEDWWTSRRHVELKRFNDRHGPGPITLADVFTADERRDPEFNYNFEEFGSVDQIHVSIDPDGDWDVELALFRERDVGRRELLIMQLLRPHLVAVYRAAQIRRRLATSDFDLDAITTLTPREREVVSCVAEGLTNREIAAELVVEQSTVQKHLEHVYEKLGVHSRTKVLAKLRAASPSRRRAAFRDVQRNW